MTSSELINDSSSSLSLSVVKKAADGWDTGSLKILAGGTRIGDFIFCSDGSLAGTRTAFSAFCARWLVCWLAFAYVTSSARLHPEYQVWHPLHCKLWWILPFMPCSMKLPVFLHSGHFTTFRMRWKPRCFLIVYFRLGSERVGAGGHFHRLSVPISYKCVSDTRNPT